MIAAYHGAVSAAITQRDRVGDGSVPAACGCVVGTLCIYTTVTTTVSSATFSFGPAVIQVSNMADTVRIIFLNSADDVSSFSLLFLLTCFVYFKITKLFFFRNIWMQLKM